MRVLGERVGRQHLGRLLERAHAVLVDTGRASDQQHRPAVRLRVRQPSQRVDHPRPGDDKARLRPPGEVAGRLRGVRSRLLVAHADVRDPLTLPSAGDRLHWETDDAEHVVDTLLLQAARHHRRAVDLRHVHTPQSSFARVHLDPGAAASADRPLLPERRHELHRARLRLLHGRNEAARLRCGSLKTAAAFETQCGAERRHCTALTPASERRRSAPSRRLGATVRHRNASRAGLGALASGARGRGMRADVRGQGIDLALSWAERRTWPRAARPQAR